MGAADANRIPIICGPTGAGKTGVAVRLAQDFPVEIISADSRQIVKHLDIGTAKPTSEEQARVPFHLVDIVEPGERYSAYRFLEDAELCIDDILSRDRMPLVVGGTGLYLRALSEGVVQIDTDSPEVRARLEEDMERLGAEEMHARLAAVDPEEAARVHPHNKVRVIRSLEVFELTGKTKSALTASGTYKRSGHFFDYFCLVPPRARLYEVIEARVDQMMSQGLLGEIETLVREGFTERIRLANVIGYAELLDYLDGEAGLDQAIAAIKQNSRRYAKRQITWFRHQADCRFFEESGVMLAALSQNAIDGQPGQ
ncbi:MAG: tRNA (adenosine(37)-N6)-dimethylallyltransferase MiaA [bacterium]|nr:tRNA (adenosine(37)-N6)-dimethylallyltransferase MiaA [bacterium]